MKTYLDCVPCFVRQAIDGCRLFTDDQEIHEKAVREVLRMASEMDLDQNPPAMGKEIHRLLRELTGIRDPYEDIKKHFNELAMSWYPKLKKRVENADDPLEMAVRLAIAGNIIDFGVQASIENDMVESTVEECVTGEFDHHLVEELAAAYADADSVLYLGDNAGEIVFDRILIEQLGPEKITFAVRGGPIINDITMVDAEYAGLTGIVEVIDNGDNAPGTILQSCSESFRDHFNRADMVIAKGQGNYETLSEVDKDVFFVLKAKCPMIAHHLGCEVGRMIFQRSSGRYKDRAVLES
ncbi:hypothetical protein STSP2_01678 [Anaerohalosphaera lusitana]|uniref:Damage-control phosphatase ARMT1-like metal-binding domain-containing protein n=1 Tax=Anaerohalosphaera lusitana TaxID=1936003 RepID=A0A1U9NKQ6_9BACT|nr:ARMT1-like domain-containing protein [Anaerohalosphaera lusitana]AQT68513.1 hypothetical protein STSP2_01678 [Anaerohalosphaera lusitana]